MTNPLTSMRHVVAAFALAAAIPAHADRFDDLWFEGREVLEPEGITKPMFRSLTVWSEGQYYLGYCSSYLPEGDVTHWRNWWANTLVPRGKAGSALLLGGAEKYQRGLSDGALQKPAKEFCRRVLESWSRDMEAANQEARRQRGH